MGFQTNWYLTINAIEKEIESLPSLNIKNAIQHQISKVYAIYKECEYYGFNWKDNEANDLINELVLLVEENEIDLLSIGSRKFSIFSEISQKVKELVPNDIERNELQLIKSDFYILALIEKVLNWIKLDSQRNLPKTLKELEKIILESVDAERLINSSQNIKRRITNKEFSSDFKILINHTKDRLETLDQLNKYNHLLPNNRQETEKLTNKKRYPAKYYALYHWILIEMGIEKNFDTDKNGKYSRSKIESFVKERYKRVSIQGFYRAFIDPTVIDTTNKTAIRLVFGRGYKKIIHDISNNDSNVINHLKNFPN